VLIITPLDQIQQNLLRKETCQNTAKPADIVLETLFEEYSTPPLIGQSLLKKTLLKFPPKNGVTSKLPSEIAQCL